MKIVIDSSEKYPTELYINEQKYVPEHEQKSIFRMDTKEISTILGVQSVETVIKLAKCCHGILYHEVRK